MSERARRADGRVLASKHLVILAAVSEPLRSICSHHSTLLPVMAAQGAGGVLRLGRACSSGQIQASKQPSKQKRLQTVPACPVCVPTQMIS